MASDPNEPKRSGIWDLAEKAQAEVDKWPEWKRRAADTALVTRLPSVPSPIDLSKFSLGALMGCVMLGDATGKQWYEARDAGLTFERHRVGPDRTRLGKRVLEAVRSLLDGLSADDLSGLAEAAVEDAHAPKFGIQPTTNRVLGICNKLAEMGLVEQTITSFWGSYRATDIGRAALALRKREHPITVEVSRGK